MKFVFQELSLHEDRIRAMCITDYGFVITGPGSRDGRIAVWKSYLADFSEQKVDKKVRFEETSPCEVDGFEMVGRKEGDTTVPVSYPRRSGLTVFKTPGFLV